MKKKDIIITILIIIPAIIILWITLAIPKFMAKHVVITNENSNNVYNEIDYNSYTKILDADLKADGVHTDILVKYNNTLYGKSYAMIDYAGNPQGPIGKIDKLIDSEYVPRLNGETNVEEIWEAEIDDIGEKSMVLQYNNEYVLFTKIEE